MNGVRPEQSSRGMPHNKLLWLIAVLLIFFGPIAGVYLRISPGILPILGIVCGLAAVVRGAQPLIDGTSRRIAVLGDCMRTAAVVRGAQPPPDGDRVASPGAQADAKILCNTTLDSSPNRGIGITDVGGGAAW